MQSRGHQTATSDQLTANTARIRQMLGTAALSSSSLRRRTLNSRVVKELDNWNSMPSGDAQRTWFPEMIAHLRSNWSVGLPMPVLIELRHELDGMLHRIRNSRNIKTPVITCPKCGKRGHAAEPEVSVRATILALARFGITSREQARALEKNWMHYRVENQLNIHGEPVDRCQH